MTEAHSRTTRAPLKTIVLQHDRFAAIAEQRGWTSNAAIARAIGVPERTVDRIIAGTSQPTIAFIAGLLVAVPELGFRRVFEPVVASDIEGRK
jgi:hypothetical protein